MFRINVECFIDMLEKTYIDKVFTIFLIDTAGCFMIIF